MSKKLIYHSFTCDGVPIYFILFFVVGMLFGFVNCCKKKNISGIVIITVGMYLFSVGFGNPIGTLIENGLSSPYNLITLLTGVVCLTISIICFINLEKRNKYGRIVLGELQGLKKFIEVARKDEIERLVSENPEYCYDILPYAYVLGVSDKWIQNFEGIMKEPPDWYKGDIHKTFSTFTKDCKSVSIPSIKNGGISRSSGGGRSGGGHGGGGGHSW